MVEIKRVRVSVSVCDSSCQDLIPSLWMVSNLEKHSTSSHGGAAVMNQRDQPAIIRLFFFLGL